MFSCDATEDMMKTTRRAKKRKPPAAGGRDDAKFGERSEDAPRFRNKLDESRAFSFLSKKKVVTLMEGEEGPAASGKISQKDQMMRLRAQVVDAYRNRR